MIQTDCRSLKLLSQPEKKGFDTLKDRLTLRPLYKDDLPMLHKLYSDEASARYMRFGKHTSLEQTRTLLRHYLEDGCLPYAAEPEKGAGCGRAGTETDGCRFA